MRARAFASRAAILVVPAMLWPASNAYRAQIEEWRQRARRRSRRMAAG